MRAQLPYQRVEGRDGEDAQAAHGQLGRARGEGQQALGIGQLAALQAGQVTAEAEQVHVELLQVLLPQEDLPDDTEKRVEPPRLALSQAYWASGATAHARLARFWADGGLGEEGSPRRLPRRRQCRRAFHWLPLFHAFLSIGLGTMATLTYRPKQNRPRSGSI